MPLDTSYDETLRNETMEVSQSMGTIAFDTISTRNAQNTNEINIIDEHPSNLEDESSSSISQARRPLKAGLDISIQSFPAHQISPMAANQSTMFFTNT